MSKSKRYFMSFLKETLDDHYRSKKLKKITLKYKYNLRHTCDKLTYIFCFFFHSDIYLRKKKSSSFIGKH